MKNSEFPSHGYIVTERNFFHFLVVSLVLLPLTGSDTARGEQTATCLPELLPSTGSDTARGERTATCLPVVTFTGKRHGSRRTDGHVSPPCYL